MNRHTIHRATIDLHRSDSEPTDAAMAREWCTAVLLEELEAVLSETCPDDQVMVLSMLQLDLTVPVWNESLRAGPKNALRQQIREQLAGQAEAATVRMPLNEYRAEILLHYMQEGSLPEIYSAIEWAELTADFQQLIQKNRRFSERLLALLRQDSAFGRWFQLTDESVRYAWLDNQLPVPAGSWRQIVGHLAQWFVQTTMDAKPAVSGQTISERELLKAIIDGMAQGITNSEQLICTVLKTNFLAKGLPLAALQKAIKKLDSDTILDGLLRMLTQAETPPTTALVGGSQPINDSLKQPSRPGQETPVLQPGMAVPVAGLVLVANFLPAFLRTVGLLDATNTFVSVRRVPMLLYCLATGETEAGEWQLVLPKLLCGLPFSESCDTSITLSEQERQEINNLLTDVIAHWTQLKTTTPDGLRGTFLQRTGRMTEKDALFALTIPEETADILLSFIPWSFRYIRFSWMPKLLITEWGNKA